ncbi:hypothetical protein KSX_55040 [Ktedonospora formicarum]|uniref:Uncharacterized protein n=1 Tax=Ktedonospora formicarum TaxID=2778364 RepID=A0A8J3I4H2_9CHLR|nr:hypothetical protein KSX_55040 [Ktedonospora formicarum]
MIAALFDIAKRWREAAGPIPGKNTSGRDTKQHWTKGGIKALAALGQNLSISPYLDEARAAIWKDIIY